ncbi:MAG TPA: chloride channel protein [Chloroflexota bacterium]|nr:chloride channel protein [Chloroflexota bacterium]
MPLPVWERTEGRAVAVLSLAAIVLGVIGALAAFALFYLIVIITNLAFYQRASAALHYPPASIAPWMILIPAIGGLLVGLMAHFGTERIRGHGIPEAMEAIVAKQSRIDVRVAVLKPISAAIAVGTGGPFGAEGPIIQTGGAIGSLIGQRLNLTAAERKVFLACGAAAGMVGIFNTPISAVALALELLLFEFRPRSLIPVVIASAVASAARTYLLGPGTMFAVPPVNYGGPLALPFFIPLGIIVGVAAVVISKGLFLVEDLFQEVFRLHVIVAPAIGGLILGLIAYVEPQVLGMGYPLITAVVESRLGTGDALKLALGKTVALWAALGSGTSGGLLAPMLLIGGALGSAYGQVVGSLTPGVPLKPEVCAIVAMSALFGAAARIPVTSFLFGFELTGDYHAILPLMIGCMVADIVARLLTEYSVMTERLAQRGVEVPRAYQPDILTYVKVHLLMRTDFQVVSAETPVRQLVTSVLQADTLLDGFARVSGPRGVQVWIVVGRDGCLVGAITERQVLAAETDPALASSTAACLARPTPVVAYPDEFMDAALLAMLRNDLSWLPVVEPGAPRRVIGYVTLNDALAARRLNLQDEVMRESIVRPGLFQAGADLAQEVERGPGE